MSPTYRYGKSHSLHVTIVIFCKVSRLPVLLRQTMRRAFHFAADVTEVTDELFSLQSCEAVFHDSVTPTMLLPC